jgi:ATP-binding cassette, subfamily B, bacterial
VSVRGDSLQEVERLPGAAGRRGPERAHTTFWEDLRDRGLVGSGAALLAAHLAETGMLLLSWVFVGSGALSGRLDYGWLTAWVLALATTVPLHCLSTWLQGVVVVGVGGVLKGRLLSGTMNIEPDLLRARGTGRALSEILETVALDDLAANGGIAASLATIELAVAPWLLAWAELFTVQGVILVGWEVLTLAAIRGNLRLRTQWTQQRLVLTQQLVENMMAQRTRILQQAPGDWHRTEDANVAHYLEISRRLDESTARIETALPRGYVVVAFTALVPGFLSGTATLEQQAVAVGVLLFAKAAFERLCFGFSRPAAALIAWQCVRDLSAAAAAGPAPGDHDAHRSPCVLQARDLTFTYPGRCHPALVSCSVVLHRGDQVLLEGASGSGKSTLAALLAGARTPSGGTVLASGLDRHTLGDAAWRRRTVLVPQYHENHIFAAPLLFNLFLNRVVPPTPAEVEEAAAICRELGLGALLEKMPAGLLELVGDSAWRLSQGERSRIFIARALLERADLLILDESFGALDPHTLRQCLECVMRRAPTMIVIAHP